MGLRRAGRTKAKPEARDISMTAVLPSPGMPYAAEILFPRGPVTFAVRMRPLVPEMTASKVPSPPSAIGTSMMRALGKPFRIPFAMQRAASMADTLSLKALGAMRILKGFECDAMKFSAGPKYGWIRFAGSLTAGDVSASFPQSGIHSYASNSGFGTQM